MATRAVLSDRGLTLVEVMIALVVLLFVSLAMMQTALVSIDANMQNDLRDEAVNIGETRLNETRSLVWVEGGADNLVSDTADTVADDGFMLPDCSDWTECICKTGEECTVSQPDKGPYPVKVDRRARNATVSYGTRRVVNKLDATNKEVKIIVRRVYKDKCYSQVVSTIMRPQ